jgi:hypothetical protein
MLVLLSEQVQNEELDFFLVDSASPHKPAPALARDTRARASSTARGRP